jgi:Mg/Co/Ni transporter MgtE
MEKAVAILAKAVTTAAAIGFLLAAVIVFDTRSLVALPFLVLTVVAGTYAWRVVQAGQTVAVAEPELKQRILVT